VIKTKTILIKGGTAVIGSTVSQQDILISGEKISAIGNLTGYKADSIIDATELLILPGAIDTHVHFNDEFMGTVSVHDYYTGTLAAAFGGVTSIVDFSNQEPGESLLNTLKRKHDEAEGKALIDWGIHPAITEPTENTLKEIPQVVKEGAPTFKCYMTYREEGLLIEDQDLKKILECLKKAGGMLMLHAEDNDLIEENIPLMIDSGKTSAFYHALSKPPEVENRALRRCVALARETGSRLFIVHMSTGEGVEIISMARAEGIDILAETCTHYLLFTDDYLKREDGIKWICSPPLRDKPAQDKLWEGIKDGRISMVSSDDAAFSWEAKLLGIDRFDKCPNGIPGVEVRFNLLYSEGVAKGRISLPRFVELVSSAPARLFGLAPQKGFLIPGADADIIVFDPKTQWKMNQQSLHMAADWTVYKDIDITGKIEKVFSRGELIIDGNRFKDIKGRGKFIHRKLDSTL